MSIGSFILIKNEEMWIGPHLSAWLPHLDQMVFFDGNSTDGTREIIERYEKDHEHGKKIVMITNKDCRDLRGDYRDRFNECLSWLKTDFAFFLHPDMFPISGEDNLKNLGTDFAWFTSMRSYAGNPGGSLFEIETGRTDKWKTIMRLKDPDLGLHYYGDYGANNEDMYFSMVTGNKHEYFKDMDQYPYTVRDSGVHIAHFSDVRAFERRLGRMISCLKNQGYPEDHIESIAKSHPRVTLQPNEDFKFREVAFVSCLEEAKKKHAEFMSAVAV